MHNIDSSDYSDVDMYPCNNVLIFQILPILKNKPNKRTIPPATITPSPLTPSPQPPTPSPTHKFRYLQGRLLHLNKEPWLTKSRLCIQGIHYDTPCNSRNLLICRTTNVNKPNIAWGNSKNDIRLSFFQSMVDCILQISLNSIFRTHSKLLCPTLHLRIKILKLFWTLHYQHPQIKKGEGREGETIRMPQKVRYAEKVDFLSMLKRRLHGTSGLSARLKKIRVWCWSKVRCNREFRIVYGFLFHRFFRYHGRFRIKLFNPRNLIIIVVHLQFQHFHPFSLPNQPPSQQKTRKANKRNANQEIGVWGNVHSLTSSFPLQNKVPSHLPPQVDSMSAW